MATSSSSSSSVNSSALLTAAGVGSGLDVGGLVTQLMSVEQQPVTLLQKQQASYQTKISALGSIKNAVASLQTASDALADPSTYGAMSATPGNSSVLAASATSSARAGQYSINVTQLAQAQVMAAAGITDPNATGSTGSLTLRVGGSSSVTLAIDSSNNTLNGIAAAINAANAGVTATIVQDGSEAPYRLLLAASSSGSANTISLTNDLSAGTLHDAIAGLSQLVAPQDAQLTVNGLSVRSASNTVADAIPGVTLTLAGAGTSSLGVAADSAKLQSGVKGLVSAYNSLNSTVRSLTAFDATAKTTSPLTGDFAARSILTQAQSLLSQSIGGASGELGSLREIGITMNADGSLALDAAKLGSAAAAQPASLAGLFGVRSTSSSALVSYVGSGSGTASGTYQLNVTAAATHGVVKAVGFPPGASSNIDGSNNNFAVSIDGVSSGTLAIPQGTYTPVQLAAAVQQALDSSSVLHRAGVGARVSIGSDGHVAIAASSYGATSSVQGVAGTLAAVLGFDGSEQGSGIDVAGSFELNGNTIAATGRGQTLSAASGTAADGLKVRYLGTPDDVAGGTSASLQVHQGFAAQLSAFAARALDATGPIATETNSLTSTIKDIGSRITDIQARLVQVQANYQAQFIALDTLLANMNQTSKYLTTQLDAILQASSTSNK